MWSSNCVFVENAVVGYESVGIELSRLLNQLWNVNRIGGYTNASEDGFQRLNDLIALCGWFGTVKNAKPAIAFRKFIQELDAAALIWLFF
ncbi:hypothetical protein AZ34_05505 [Hylemonella gracilis str. Niagara R]|uniref:Uncharacterized protein n=1 Tax=Hylemonella gracilis str. Niagara R TaxID=1458275 RepID=A0A016XLT4_9BURK|nr:hypothetical protein AZ34_05505 [Hylemonella gracilis str. Niagara R]